MQNKFQESGSIQRGSMGSSTKVTSRLGPDFVSNPKAILVLGSNVKDKEAMEKADRELAKIRKRMKKQKSLSGSS